VFSRAKSASIEVDFALEIRLRSPVAAADQVYRGDAAQRLRSVAQDWRIGARARYQADREPDFRKRVLRAERAERIGRGKNYLEIGAPCFQTGKELGHVGTEQIASASTTKAAAGRERQNSSALAKMPLIPERPEG